MLKRTFDIALSLVALLVASPLCLLLGFMIMLRLGNPIIFSQQRPGLNGKPFCIKKFRTMRNACDVEGKLLSDEQRMIPLGQKLRRWSLDELPQLFNVIKGDISLVGPRPLLMEYLPLYNPKQARRHDVKPGITGWAQVNGRNAISWEEKFEYDLWYVDHQSFLLDMKILWMTLLKVIRSEGVAQSGHATMEKFRGSPK